MSEQEKKSGGSAIGGSMVMVDKTPSSRHTQPYRPTELQDNTDLHHKRSRAPFVPSVAEELRCFVEDNPIPLSGIEKQNSSKKLTSSQERHDYSPDSHTLATIEVERKKGVKTPIPDVQTTADQQSADLIAAEKEAAKGAEEDSITEEVQELRTPDVAKKYSEWSDDEEAGGLPRSDSRASRVSRMVRQFFCCGVSYEAPSEDNISTHRGHGI